MSLCILVRQTLSNISEVVVLCACVSLNMKSFHSMTEAVQVVSARHSLPQMLKLHEQLIATTYTFQEPNHAMGARRLGQMGLKGDEIQEIRWVSPVRSE